MKRKREQAGTIVQISGRWFLRYNESQNKKGVIHRVKVSHPLGEVTTRGSRPPGDITDAAKRHMLEVNQSRIRPECTVTLADFVEDVHLAFMKKNRRRSTHKGYAEIWRLYIKPHALECGLKDIICADVQQWFDAISGENLLAKNTLARMRSFLSGVFKNAKRLGYYSGTNPARDIFLSPDATKPKPTYAYCFEEITQIMNALPEPASTIFAVAAFSGLRVGEIEGLRWEDYDSDNGELHVSRSIWQGVTNEPKTEDSAAAVPIIPFLSERLERHRLRSSENGHCSTERPGVPEFAG